MNKAKPARRQAEAKRNDQALLEAARAVVAIDGIHATVAAIAARAGVGIGSLYRRYRTKEDLFRHLLVLAGQQWIERAEHALKNDDPWDGLAEYITSSIQAGSGSLGALAGHIEFEDEDETSGETHESDRLFDRIVKRAHDAGVLRKDVSSTDISLLIEQFSRSPLIEQLEMQQRFDLLDEARNSRSRLVAVVLDGMRTGRRQPLPGTQPSQKLFSERWMVRQDQ